MNKKIEHCCDGTFVYALDVSTAKYGSSWTGKYDDDEAFLNRYCGNCRKQLGFIDLAKFENDFTTGEFGSIELDRSDVRWKK